MFRLFVLLAAVACALGSVIQPRVPLPDGRIVGGEDTTINEHPYQVSVLYDGSHLCGGSIISSKVILTAAHCIFDNTADYSIQYGQTTLSSVASTTVAVTRGLRHPSYNDWSFDCDVGLLFVSTIPFTDVSQPIVMATETPAPGTTAIVTGWGTTREGGRVSHILQKVSVPIVDREACKQQYKEFADVTKHMLCAGFIAGGKDSCQGDSGGPLVVNGILVGIVSWGYGCARAGYPGVYTDVASVQTWIKNNM